MTAREDDGMEWYVVFAKELVQLDLFGVEPPLLPLRGVVGCDGWIANTSFEPDIQNLLLKPRQRYWYSPLQISRNASIFQSRLQP